MRIVFDHQAFSLQNTGGITRYFFELIKHFSIAENISPEVLLGFSSTIWPIKEWSKPNGQALHWGPRLISSGMITYVINELLLNAYVLTRGQYDIYHNTLYRFMPAVRAHRFVATHHDCIQERFPHLFPDHGRIIRTKRRMFRQADLVLCVSEASRVDLQEFYDVEPERTRVVYNGVSPMHRSDQGRIEMKKFARRPFILYVGIRASYKNFDGLLRSFARSGLLETYDLVVIGGGSFSESERKQIQELGLQSCIISIPTASAELLAEAYAITSLLVYPSLYEGFGLPPLEAMMMATPVLVASSPATREVCQDAAFFFDPFDEADFVDKLIHALHDTAARRDKIKQGSELIQRYRWTKTADQVLSAYRSLL